MEIKDELTSNNESLHHRGMHTLFGIKLSGRCKERNWDGSFISVNFQILDLSISSVTLGSTSGKVQLSPLCKKIKLTS